MAKTGAIPLKGKVGNLVFYEFRGVPCVRTTPSKVRQTKATKASAKIFGIAVSMSAALRWGLGKFLPVDKGRKIMYRLNTALLQWLKLYEPGAGKGVSTNLTEINGFEFCEDCSLFARLRVRVSVEWSKSGPAMIQISELVPIRDIAAPAQTKAVLWNIALASCTVNDSSTARQKAALNFEMPYHKEKIAARQIEFPFKLNPGELAIAAVSLQYRIPKGNGSSIVTNPKWLPSAIVGSAYSR